MDWQKSLEKEPETRGRTHRVLSTLFFRLSVSLILAFAILTAPLAPIASATKLVEAKAADRSSRLATTQAGDTVVFYGPQQFTRASGSPVTVTQQFSVPFGVVAPFTIQIQNGAPDGTHRVSSATIHLNGVELFTQNEIKDSTPAISQTVPLQSSNVLAVKLTSSIGSFLTISFSGNRIAVPPASLVSINPIRATQGQSLTVALQGQNTHWLPGVTQASFGQEVSVNGAPAGELGNITVTSPTTAIAQVAVSGTAALSPRTVRVLTPNVPAPFPLNLIQENVTLADAFTVVATSPPGPSSTTVATIAGLAGTGGFADGVASQARFQNPAGLAVSADETVYIADAGNNRIRRLRSEVAPEGGSQWVVLTLAGNGTYGFADGPASAAQFKNPQGVAVDANGVVFVADTSNHRIRRIAADGTVSTFAGDGTPGLVDGAGNQARFNSPRGIAVDQQGNIYVADTGNAAVRLVNASGQVSTLAGDGTVGSTDVPARFDCPAGVAVNGSTVYVYLADKGNHRIRRLDSTGTVITIAGQDRGFADGAPDAARFAEPSGIAIDASGNIVVTDAVNSLIRQVDPVLAASGSTGAVSTLAGSGERGTADGAGSVAAFLTPRGVVSTSSSAIIVADTGNHTLRRLTLPPVISSFSPASGKPGETININGVRFDGRGPERNTVRFARAPELGGGQIVATVTAASQTQLLVTVPDDAATGVITVQTEGGTAVSATSFEVLPPTPLISDFDPHAGAVGSTVTLNGLWLKANSGEPVVTFAGRGGTRLQALVFFASRTQVKAIVPNAAITGRIELTNVWGQTATSQDFVVNATQDFQLVVAPASATAVQRSSATYVIQLTSSHPTFTQLARLTVTGLPAGVEATLESDQITAGGSTTLTLNLANADLAAASYPFSINAAADVDGVETVRTAAANLSVLAAGQTTLSGRVLSTENEPIIGATISLDGQSATTDAAGSFLLRGVTAGAARPVMIDGRTASAPNRTYPVLAEPANIVAGEANAVPYVFYLPPIDVEHEKILVPGQTTVITTPRVPGLQLTVPAGANLRNRDNTPVTRVSITPVPIDRTPTPLPSDVTTAMVYTNQPGGAISDAPMPMVFPNLQGADPGTRADLYAFNHDTVQWYVYGYGRVSEDGRLIVPEIDPATGQPYGLIDFSWYFPSVTTDGNPGDNCPCPSNRTGDPVDLSTGVKIETMTDVAFGGVRGGIELTRVFTSDLAAFVPESIPAIIGRFGRGTKDSYDVRLSGTFNQGGAGRVIFPEERAGRLFSYVRTDPNGSHVFASSGIISQRGNELHRLTDGTFEYRLRAGQVLRFDSSRRMTAIVDRNGNATTLTYTGSRLTSVTDAVGRSLTFTYNAENFVERVTDPLGRRWLYTYSPAAAAKQLASVTDPLDNVINYTYSGGALISISDKRGQIAKTIQYSPFDGRVSKQIFADGGFESYSYQASGRLVSSAAVTDSLGRSESKRFNFAGYVLGTRDSQGQGSTIDRDITTNLKLTTRGACGCVESTDEFDARGNLLASTNRLGQTARWEYEPVFNNVIRSIDRLNRETSFGYDPKGNLTSITNELNQTITLTYDNVGQLTAVKDPLNHTTTMEYDTHGNVVAVVDPLNHRTTFEYDALGRPTAVIDPLNRRNSQTYDAMGRTRTTTDPNNAVTTFNYDADGHVISVIDALQQKWEWFYDEKGRPTTQKDPLNRISQFTYNSDNQLIEAKSPLNRITKYGYDPRGQLLSVTDPLNQVARFAYDNRQNLTMVIDKRGYTTTYTYDELSRVTGKRNPLGQFTDITYNAVNNVTSFTDEQGRRTSIVYDELHRPSQVTYPDASVSYTYDTAGRATRIADTQGGAIEWAYDEANRLLSETTSAGVVSYGYNAANQRTSMTAASGLPVNYGYDSAGRLQTIAKGTDTFTFGYDTLSRISSIQRPNGITTTLNYDLVNRLARLRHANSLDQPLEDFRYTYTLDDQISSITSVSPNQLLPAAKTATTADAANRITQLDSTTYSFNSLGQTTSKTDAQGTTNYQWDARGRLTGATLPSGQTVSYGYDSFGRRTSRSTNGVTTQFLHDGDEVVQESRSDQTGVDYVNGPGIDYKLRQSSAATGSLYFLNDHLGSTKALTNAAGSVVEQRQYDAFGSSAGSSLTRYGFTGRDSDEDTGLLYYRARWYDSQQGRFLSEDPIGLAGGLNAYAYVANNPLSFIDPYGLSLESFMEGFTRAFVVSAAVSFVIAAAIAASGGAVAAVVGALIAAYGAYQLYDQIKELMTANLCQDEFDEKLGELLGGTLGGMLGGGAGARVGRSPRARDFWADETGSAGRPGKMGGPDHRQKVQDTVDKIEAQGLEAKREYKVDTPQGSKNYRMVDVVARDADKNVMEMYQIGKQTKGHNPVSREQKAIDDINQATGMTPKFIPYNCPP